MHCRQAFILQIAMLLGTRLLTPVACSHSPLEVSNFMNLLVKEMSCVFPTLLQVKSLNLPYLADSVICKPSDASSGTKSLPKHAHSSSRDSVSSP